MPEDPIPILIERLERLFEQQRDPARAVAARAYMRAQFAFFGIASPLQKQLVRQATEGLATPTEAQVVRLARICWRKPEREWQYFACVYLRRHVGQCSPRFIDTAQKLIVGKSWWDTVDSLASHTVGPLVLAHPGLATTMDRWIASENIWIARTALLHQLSYKARTDTDRLFAYCAQRAGDREFFIRKASGWALREYSKTDEHAVLRFVHDHRDDLSPLSRTEALKWLDRRKARLT